MAYFSVITPSWNQAKFLKGCIESVLGQNDPDFEHLIFDNCSEDGSAEIASEFSHLKFVREKDRGQSDAVNKGFRHTTGDVMAWLNSDDVYFPWTLKTVGSIFAQLTDVSWLSSLEQTRIDYQGYCLGSERVAGFSREAFAEGCYVANPGRRGWFLGWIQQESTFWRRSLWNAAGAEVRSHYSLAGDFDLWARFYRHAELFEIGRAHV